MSDSEYSVDEVYARYLDQLAEDPSADFDAFCAAHPDRLTELRALHSQCAALPEAGDFRWPDAGAGTRDGVAHGAESTQPIGGRGRYRMRDQIGKGGMGAVLRVWDPDLKRDLAMKVSLKAEPDGRASKRRARFVEEAQITGQLDHPTIVPVHELGCDERGHAWFTMKLVEGRTFDAIIERVHAGDPEWTWTRAVGCVLRVCEGLAYAHAKGVIHRDVKPSNVMVGDYGAVYVTDWGLAGFDARDARAEDGTRPVETELRSTARPDSALLTAEGDVFGTPAFMAPEQAAGRASEVGPRADVYAVGAVLYQLLTGAAPYADRPHSGTQELLAEVRSGPPTAAAGLAPAAPAELVSICERAMQRRPEDRYADMTALADDLRRWLEGHVVQAHRTGVVIELRKWAARNRALAATLVFAAALLVLGAGAAWSAALEAQRRATFEDMADFLSAIERAEWLAESSELYGSDGLWPPTPDRVETYETWLAHANAIAALRPEVARRLVELRESAARSEDGSWSLADEREQVWHDQLSRFLDRIDVFDDPQAGLIAGRPEGSGWSVRSRLDFARTIEERSVTGSAARASWDEAIASIADPAECPAYHGLEIPPQLGLLPLGRDQSSGLWEFAYLLTGEPPMRDPETGVLAFTPESAIVLTLLPGGEFLMGSQKTDPELPNYDDNAVPDEGPVHVVALDPFFVSKYELTQGQWDRFMGDRPSLHGPEWPYYVVPHTDLRPVEQVSWRRCYGALERMGLLLPTEAQWEYAARGGTDTPWWTGVHYSTLKGAVNIADLTARRAGATWSIDPEIDWEDGWYAPAEVHSLRPNPFGLHHVLGNVWEWCLESPVGDYTGLPPDGPRGIRFGGNLQARVARGGSYSNQAFTLRSAYRNWEPPITAHSGIGVRPVRVLQR